MSKGVSIAQFVVLMLTVIILGNYSLVSLGTESCVLCFLIWIPTIISRYSVSTHSERVLVVLSFVYTFIITAYKLVGVSSAPWGVIAAYPSWLLIMIIGVTAYHTLSNNQMKLFFWFFVVVTIVNMLSFVRTNLSFDLAEYYGDIAEAGRTMYGTSIMLLTSIFFFAIFKTKVKWQKIVYILFCLISIVIITVVLQKVTNVVLLVVSMVLIYAFGRTNNRKKILLVAFVFLQLVVYLYISGALIEGLNWLSNNIEGRMSGRIQSFAILIETGDSVEAGSSVAERSQLMWRSWFTFLDNLFGGIGDHRIVGGPVGNHSEIIDNLARYGILGGISIFYIFSKQYKFLLNGITGYNDRQLYICLKVVFALYVFRNFYGAALSASISTVMFIFFPIAMKYIMEKGKEINL